MTASPLLRMGPSQPRPAREAGRPTAAPIASKPASKQASDRPNGLGAGQTRIVWLSWAVQVACYKILLRCLVEAAGHRSHVLPMRAKNLVHTCIINHPANCHAVIWSTTSSSPHPPPHTHTHTRTHTRARKQTPCSVNLDIWLAVHNSITFLLLPT